MVVHGATPCSHAPPCLGGVSSRHGAAWCDPMLSCTPMPWWCVTKAWCCMVRPHALMHPHALNRQKPLAAQATPKSWIRVNRASTLLCTGTVRLVCCTLRRRMLPRGPPRGPCSTDIFSKMTSGSQGLGLRVNCYRYRHIRTTSSMITRSQGLE